MHTTGASGTMLLLTEVDDDNGRAARSLRLEATADGKCVFLLDIDERKPGNHRQARYEITPAELIAAIRTHCIDPANEALHRH